MDPKHKKIAEAVKAQGISHFLVGLKNGPLVSIYFQDMSIKDAMEVMIAGFHQVVGMEVDKHPDYPEEQKKLLLDMSKGFNDLIKATDKKLSEIRNK